MEQDHPKKKEKEKKKKKNEMREVEKRPRRLDQEPMTGQVSAVGYPGRAEKWRLRRQRLPPIFLPARNWGTVQGKLGKNKNASPSISSKKGRKKKKKKKPAAMNLERREREEVLQGPFDPHCER